MNGAASSPTTAIRRIALTVRDLEGTAAFYRDALGFSRLATIRHEGTAFARLTGLPGARATAAVMQLGAEEIELVAFEPAGRAYPADSTAADPLFQHFAIVVADMAAAYANLVRHPGHSAISTGGPQHLPPNTGGVTAYKFRDPEGHPLELSQLPPGIGADRWHHPGRHGCLGIDHSAVGVASTARAVAFYTGVLGMAVTARLTNRGAEQDRLDGLHAEGVRITVIEPGRPNGPHLELLDYGAAARPATPSPLRADDVAATRLVLEAADLPGLVGRLVAAGGSFVSQRGMRTEAPPDAVVVRDPDGHLLQLLQQP